MIRNTRVANGSGTTLGYFRIYYSGGYNCARLDISAAGKGLYYKIGIVRCRQTSPSLRCDAVSGTSDLDSGTFSSYAGPVTTYAPQNCIGAYFVVKTSANGSILAVGGTPYDGGTVWSEVGAAHCG